MARFLAITSRGLGDALNREVVDLGLKVLNHNQAGVLFESNWQQMYSANLCLRTATRILLPVLDFAAYDPDQLYGNMRRHDFTKYINEDDTLAVVATVSEAGPFPNELFVAQKVKDAIVDQFSNKYGRRPSVDKKNPTMKVWVKVKGSNISVSIDTSGESLSQRGYRQDQGLAPLREHLAAGLISQTGWRGECTLIDPMCGSGTLLIEAALLVLNKGPGLY